MRDQNDVTNPGAAPGEASVIADDSEDEEFPSEATRVDASFSAGAKPTPAAAGSLESLAAARKSSAAAAPAARPAPHKPNKPAPGASSQKNKLAALQSLSLDGGGTGSTRLPPAPRQQGGSKLPWVLLVLIGAGYGGNIAWHKYKLGGPAEVTGPVIRTETVQQTGGAGQTLSAAGNIAPRDPITVGAAMGGLVKEVKVKNGDTVRKDQIIVNLDDSTAVAEYAAIRAEVVEDERAAKTMENLFKVGAATAIQVGQAKSATAIARARLSGPEAKMRAAHIRTFTPGTVLEVLVHPGETVALNGPVVKLADLHNLNAEADVQESEIPKVRRNQEVDITSDTFPDKAFKGTVAEIGEQADKTKGTVLVKVAVQVQEDTLRPGMSVKCVFLPMKGEKPRIYISRSALTPASEVFVVATDHHISARKIAIGPSQGSQVEVLSGLKTGEEIVSDATGVHDGQVLPSPPPQ